MDMGFINAINASSHFPPHDPWMSGETLNYYYFGHVVLAWPIKLLGLRARLRLPALPGACCSRSPRTAVYAFAGTLWAAARAALRRARAARRAGAGRPARRGARRVLGNLAGVRTWLNAADPPHDYAVVRALARDPEHDQRVPVVLVHPRRPARARARAAVHGARAGVRAAGGAGRAARRRGLARGGRGAGRRRWRSARCTRSTRGRIPSRRACWPPRSWSGCATRRASAGASYALALAGAGDRSASFVLILPFVLNFNPEARGVGVVHARRPFTKWLGDMALIYGILAVAAAGRVREPACAAREAAGGCSAGGSRSRVVAGSLLAAEQPDRRDGAGHRRWRSAIGAALSPELDRAGALPVDADRRRRWRCC